jgi:hypothetical protein
MFMLFAFLESVWADWRLPGAAAPATPIAPNASSTARREVAHESGLNGIKGVLPHSFVILPPFGKVLDVQGQLGTIRPLSTWLQPCR